VAQALNNLAALYLYQGRHDDAEPLLKRSVTVFEKSLGPMSPELVEALDNLVGLYKDKGRYADAAPIAKRAAAIRAKAAGQKI
jgi:tetratricopeptide (TPR) repeat protein